MNDFTGTDISHVAYGKGVIVKTDGNKLTVRFESGAEKQFLFPDSIGKFLMTSNNELIEAAQKEKVAAEAAIEKERQMRLEAEAQKHLLEAEEKKKPSAKRKAARAKKI